MWCTRPARCRLRSGRSAGSNNCRRTRAAEVRESFPNKVIIRAFRFQRIPSRGAYRFTPLIAVGESTMDDRKSSERKAGNAARETAGRVGETARETADRVQESSTRATEGFRDYQLKVLSAAQANINAMFEYVHD